MSGRRRPYVFQPILVFRSLFTSPTADFVDQALNETSNFIGNSVPEFRRCGIAPASYDFVMKTSNFRIVALSTEVAQAARRAAANGAPDHAIIVADSRDGFPCRHCLRFAQSGERVILFPYKAIPDGHPYSESGPIFVHAEPCERYGETRKFPTDFRRGRVLRAYNSNYDMIDAEVVNGNEPEAVIEKFLQKPETAFVDARSVTRGCYTFRIQPYENA
ncbi:MAG: hypothetical protein DME46_08440 [Verrucomicrobia bacterium]|nr:MAG: hypothetical protein DME46_08440 [Verrucomicrobiota bacterium]